MELHSPEDYAVEFKIPKEAWTRFISGHKEERPGAKSNLIAFKNSLMRQVNQALRSQNDSQDDVASQHIGEPLVADV